MELGNFKKFFLYLLIILTTTFFAFAEDKIESVPLINLEELSPTFEEDKTELEKIEDKSITLNENENISDELKLSHLTYWVEQFSKQRKPFGLRLPASEIGPDLGENHRRQMLRALALFGLDQT